MTQKPLDQKPIATYLLLNLFCSRSLWFTLRAAFMSPRGVTLDLTWTFLQLPHLTPQRFLQCNLVLY